MLARVLSPLRCKNDQLARKVDLAPLQPAYLITPLAGEQEQAQDVAKTIIAKAVPKRLQLLRR